MSLLAKLPEILNKAKDEYECLLAQYAAAPLQFEKIASFGAAAAAGCPMGTHRTSTIGDAHPLDTSTAALMQSDTIGSSDSALDVDTAGGSAGTHRISALGDANPLDTSTAALMQSDTIASYGAALDIDTGGGSGSLACTHRISTLGDASENHTACKYHISTLDDASGDHTAYDHILRHDAASDDASHGSAPTLTANHSASNDIYICDNLALLASGVAGGELAGLADLIYCDPPFFTQADQDVNAAVHSAKHPEIKKLYSTAYSDVWDRDMAGYLRMLAVRLFFMRDVLKDTGSIFIHLDWHAVHAVKLLMDEIFGYENFINEIIWTYKSGGAAKRHFARKHDTILFYSKTSNYKFFPQREKSYNRSLKPYRFKGVDEYQDDIGWYTLVNQKDVWQVDMVGRSSGERVSYATQKPEALIDRIVAATTEEGDCCMDFFSGSGTLAACAAKAGRRFFACDESDAAAGNLVKRLLRFCIPFDMWAAKGKRERMTYASLAEVDFKPERICEKSREAFETLAADDRMALVDFLATVERDSKGAFEIKMTSFRDRKGWLAAEDCLRASKQEPDSHDADAHVQDSDEKEAECAGSARTESQESAHSADAHEQTSEEKEAECLGGARTENKESAHSADAHEQTSDEKEAECAGSARTESQESAHSADAHEQTSEEKEAECLGSARTESQESAHSADAHEKTSEEKEAECLGSARTESQQDARGGYMLCDIFGNLYFV